MHKKTLATLLCGLAFWIPLFNLVLGIASLIVGIASIREIRQQKLSKKYLALTIVGMLMGLIAIIGWSIYGLVYLMRNV